MSEEKSSFLGVQALRGLAAIMVVFNHESGVVWDHFHSMHNQLPEFSIFLGKGSFGVDIFFPISGFVIYLSTTKHAHNNAALFLWHRIIRIVPLYWSLTILKLIIMVIAPSTLHHYRFLLWHTVASFLFLPAYDYGHAPEPVVVVGWTLSYEMLFYCIVSVAIWRKLSVLWTCAGTISVLAVIGLFINHDMSALTYLADPIELEFLGGVFIAHAYIKGAKLPPWLASLAVTASFIFALSVHGIPIEFKPWRAAVWGIPGILIVWSIVSLETKMRPFIGKTAILIGNASYSLYLTHTFIAPALGNVIFRFSLPVPIAFWAYVIGGAAACVAFAVVFYTLVERPITRWLMRNSKIPRRFALIG